MAKRLILDNSLTRIILERIALQITENHGNLDNCAIIGMQPRGILLARKLLDIISRITNNKSILYGELDSTFYRDDFRKDNKRIKDYGLGINLSKAMPRDPLIRTQCPLNSSKWICFIASSVEL